jgi:HEAT repeats
MDSRLKSDKFADPQPAGANRKRQLLVTVSVIVLAVVTYVLLRPAAARAAWAGFAHVTHINREVPGTVDLKEFSDPRFGELRPQQQAKLLLDAAINQSEGATAQIITRAPGWCGRLTQDSQLTGLLNTALNSPDRQVRVAGLEVELSANDLPKNSAGVNALIARMDRQPAARPWGLWMLGALGNRGIEPDRALAVLTRNSRDSDEQTRLWAVEGLSLLGSDQSVSRLLDVLESDSSPAVRERAASGLAKSGMLSKQQRTTAVPALIDVVSDSSIDSATRALVYQTLRFITGASVSNDPAAWRSYWAENSSR